MQQSNVIFAALLIAFIVYVVSKGEGATYLAFLTGGGNAAPSPSSSNDTLNIDVTTSGTSGGGSASSILGNSSGDGFDASGITSGAASSIGSAL